MNIRIVGAKGNIKKVEDILKIIEKFGIENKAEIQLVNAKLIYSKNHLYSAVLHANRANKMKGKNQKLGIEILLYASCEKQISKALKKIGINNNTKEFGIIIIGECNIKYLLESLNLYRDDSVLKGDFNTLKNFGISQEEIENLNIPPEDLLLEKIALLNLIK